MRFNKIKFTARSLVFLFVIGSSSVALAQNAAVKTFSRTKDFKLDSKLMKREMPYRVILPVDYNSEIEKPKLYPTLYLLHGLTGHFNNWSENTKLEEYSKKHGYIIVMPEGNNGWYTDSATAPDDKYESYIVKELMPEIENNFRAKKTRDGRAIAGLSMGGYGAVKFGLKYPGKFAVIGAFSGAVRAAEWTEKELQPTGMKALISSIGKTYGDAGTETRKENDVFAILKTKSAEEIKKLPFIYVDCGTEDFLIGQNRDLANLLLAKRAKHEFRQLPGRHDWKFWDSQIQEFLKISERFIK